MTTVWGPLGWMTLHSVATCYPEAPTAAERQLMSSWLDMFRDTITCVHCKQHFTELLATYRTSFPNMLATRHDFVVFTFRAHNAVNRRLNKPIYNSVEECMETLRTNVKLRKAQDYRISYINHITRYWRTMQDVSGVTSTKKIAELKKIDIEYIQPRDTNFDVTLRADIVVLPRDALEKVEPGIFTPRPMRLPPTTGGLRLGPGGFRFRK
jgi:hypothetical protein